jgi:hypothetical protein
MTRNRAFRGVKIALFAIVAVTVVSLVVMGLWNALIPGIFGLRRITPVQALGLLVLSKILFGGFRPGGGGHRWRRRMMDRWEQMTPEERERFKQGVRRGCGRSVPAEVRTSGAEAGA